MSGTEAIRTWDDHKIGIEALSRKFDTNKDTGLTEAKVAAHKAQYGDNALSKKDVVPWYCLFFHELTGFFSLLLWFGSFLCFIGFGLQKDKDDKANLWLGIVLAAVTLLTGIFSYM